MTNNSDPISILTEQQEREHRQMMLLPPLIEHAQDVYAQSIYLGMRDKLMEVIKSLAATHAWLVAEEKATRMRLEEAQKEEFRRGQ